MMVGNTYPYQLDDWKKGTWLTRRLSSLTWPRDINLALEHGIDGFALNIGSDDWQVARVADAYNAAQGTKFQLFISFDMAYLLRFPSTAILLLTCLPIGSSHVGRAQMLSASGSTSKTIIHIRIR